MLAAENGHLAMQAVMEDEAELVVGLSHKVGALWDAVEAGGCLSGLCRWNKYVWTLGTHL